VLLFLLLGTVSHEHRVLHRREYRYYLTRSALLQSPRGETAWNVLRHQRIEKTYVVMMGIDVQTFDWLLEMGFEDMWDSCAISVRNDVAAAGCPRPSRRSLDAAGGLGLVSTWLNSMSPEMALQMIFAITPAVCSRYLTFAHQILLTLLKRLPEEKNA
jgi:hypothetical protein